MRKSFERQIHESRRESDKQAKKEVGDRNVQEGRSFVKGIFDKEKTPLQGKDLLHIQALDEDRLRNNANEVGATGSIKRIRKNELTGQYVPDETVAEKMRVVREEIDKILPGNFVEELAKMKTLRLSDSGTYDMLLTDVFNQANGGVDAQGQRIAHSNPTFAEWSVEDCKEFLKDLGEAQDLELLESLEEKKNI